MKRLRVTSKLKKGGETALWSRRFVVFLKDLQILCHGFAAAPFQVKHDQLALFQPFNAGTAQSRDIDENVLAVLRFDPADSTAGIEPFHISMQHFRLLSILPML